jgi:hypothetical protein
MDRIGRLRVSTDSPISLAASALALKADLGIAVQKRTRRSTNSLPRTLALG